MMTREDIIRALMAMPIEDSTAIAHSLAAGVLRRARDDRRLAPVLADLLELQGIVVLTADDVGPGLESTAHDDAQPECIDLVKRLHTMIETVIDSRMDRT